MFQRTKRLNAFVIGCLISTITFGFPAQLLAQSAPTTANIQGVTSTTQSAPTTAAQVNDVVTGINAGVNAGSLINPAPDPIREYTAFLSSMWDQLLYSNYTAGTSYLSTGEWINGPTGTVTATNETGNTLTVDIALSLEILPDQWSFVDQATLDSFASVSARMGMAWTTMTNADQVLSNIIVYWIQWDGPEGTSTKIMPMSTSTQDDVDLLAEIIPLMGDFFDNPLYYNIENYDPATFGMWSRFRNRIQSAVVWAAAGIVTAAVVVTVIALAPVEVTALVVAGAALAGAVAGGATYVVGETAIAAENLLDDLGAGPAIHGAEIRAVIDMMNEYSSNGLF